ncbi:MAG TPA: hypothetical protein VK465_10045, partial [Fibrobacteria bacterium]|nr:hypothetical protein [Fibrobacteria bacterium]
LAALSRSCESLSAGTVVAVRDPKRSAPEEKSRDSLTTPYLAVGVRNAKADGSAAGYSDIVKSGVILVPLAGCVPAPGTSETTFDLTVQSAAGGRDLLVEDIADRCLSH